MLKVTTAGTRRTPYRRLRAVLAFGAALTVALLVAACGGSNSSSTQSGSVGNGAPISSGGGKVATGPGGTVRIRSIDDLDTFDPAKTGAPNMAVQAIELTYDRLVYLDPAGKIKPYLATSWTTSPSSVTLKIRQGATCSDGTAVTPAVIVNSLKYELAKATGGPYLQYVTGPGAVKSISASGDSVTISLTKPYNALLTALATAFPTSIICPSGLADKKGLSAAPAGSGPYTLDKSSSRGSSYVFKLRSDYSWGPEGWTAKKDGIPSTIVARVATDETTGANLFSAGAVDVAPVFGINEPRIAGNKSGYTFTTQSLQMGSWGTVFNQDKGRVGADPVVRHAAFLALDSNAMVKAAFSNEGVAFKTEATPNMQCYNPAVGDVTPGYDIAQAQSLLKQAGYTLGAGGVMTKSGKPLTMKLVMWNTTNQLGDYMQQALQKVGIKATLQNTDINTWIKALFTTKDYDLSVYAYYSSFPNPVIMPAQDASLSIHDPEYTKLSQAAEQAPSGQDCPAWDAALRKAVDNFDVKPMGVSKNVWFGKGWQFAAPYNVYVDPFTLEKTQ